jgi:MFS family permease
MKGNILVLIITRLMQSFLFQMAMPFLSLYIGALRGTDAAVGLVFSLGPLAGVFVYPIAGYLADSINRVKLIGIMGIISSITYLFYVFAQHWSMLGLGYFLGGFMIFHIPAMSALMADSLSPEQRGVGFATLWALPGAIGILSPAIAGVLISVYGLSTAMRYIYASTVVVGIITSLIQIKFLRETTTGTKSKISMRSLPSITKESYKTLRETVKWMPKNTRSVALILILSFFFNSIAGPFWVVYGTSIIALTEYQWGLILLVSSALSVALTIPAGAITDRFGKRNMIIAGLAMSLFPVFFFVYSSTFMEVLVIFVIISIINSFLIPACSALVADIVPRQWRGRVMSLMGRGVLHVWSGGYPWGGAAGMGFLLSIPMMIGSFIGGYIYGSNPTYPWLLLSASIVLSLVVTIVFLREPKEPEL